MGRGGSLEFHELHSAIVRSVWFWRGVNNYETVSLCSA
jgi:hypothetical protein